MSENIIIAAIYDSLIRSLKTEPSVSFSEVVYRAQQMDYRAIFAVNFNKNI